MQAFNNQSIVLVVTKLLGLAASFLVTRLLLMRLSAVDFSTWLVLVTIFNIIQSIDLGHINGSKNRLTDVHIEQNHEIKSALVFGIYMVSFITCLTLIGITLLIPNFHDRVLSFLNIESEYSSVLKMIIYGGTLVWVLKASHAVLTAENKHSFIEYNYAFPTIFSAIILYFTSSISFFDWTLAFITINLGVSLLINLIATIKLWKAPDFALVLSELNKLKQEIGSHSLISLAFIILYMTDVLIIQKFYGEHESAKYSLYWKMFYPFVIIYNVIVRSKWNIMRAYFIKDFGVLKRLVLKLLGLWVIMVVIPTLLIVIFDNLLLIFWVSSDTFADFRMAISVFSNTALIALSSLLAAIVNVSQYLFLQRIISFAIAFGNPLLSYLLVSLGYDSFIVVVSTSIAFLVGVIVSTWQVASIFNKSNNHLIFTRK